LRALESTEPVGERDSYTALPSPQLGISELTKSQLRIRTSEILLLGRECKLSSRTTAICFSYEIRISCRVLFVPQEGHNAFRANYALKAMNEENLRLDFLYEPSHLQPKVLDRFNSFLVLENVPL